jgi:hypothetical protein
MAIWKGLVVVLVLGVGGCASYRAAIAARGAAASDATLESALWTLCNAIPVGAVNRRFRSEVEREAYATLCATLGVPGQSDEPGGGRSSAQ